ncbi:MAG: Dityrosine transporter 1 [Vezdaea aestivalis]|nr:MAG: Dityrosine transporter 1 [Vezdaea aestivalis]
MSETTITKSDNSSMNRAEKGIETVETKPSPPSYTAFPASRRKFIIFIVTFIGFFGPLSGGIYLPALNVLSEAYHVSDNQINATVSVFMLIFAFGPLIWASLADYRGRRPLYIVSFAVFIVANILLASVPAKYGALVALRIVQALGGSSVTSLGAGTIADMVEPKYRASAMSLFLLGPQLGPVLGPVIGGLLTGRANWRWIFGFLAIAGSSAWLLLLFCLPETLRSRVGNGTESAAKPWVFLPSFASKIAKNHGPPGKIPTPKMFWNLFCYPPIAIVSCNTAILFSTYYCIAVTLPRVLARTYHWSTTEVGLAFLASGVGMIIGSLAGGRFSDRRRARAVKASPEGKVAPERRLADQIWGVLLCAAGTLMYGWFCDRAIHPAAVLAGTFLAGFGMTWVFVTSTAFLTECFPANAAGVFALGVMLRNPAAALAAVITEPLISRMGFGWCFTGLAVMEFVLAGGAVLLLRVKSPSWRTKREAKLAQAAAAAKK